MSRFDKFWKKRKRWTSWFLMYAGRILIHLIMKTCRVKIIGAHEFKETVSKGPCILMLWHNRLAPMAHLLSRIAPQFTYGAVVSNSRDGELLANLVSAYPQGKTIRVVHNAKHKALREVIQHLNEEKTVVVMTPDGPRGPRYRIKPGIVLAAKSTSAQIVPLSWSASRFWQLKTWDKFLIPKPFSRIILTFGPAQLLPADANFTLDECTSKLESTMNVLDKSIYNTITRDSARWPD